MHAAATELTLRSGRAVFDEIRRAAARLDGVAKRTPVLTSRSLDAAVGGAVFLKADHLQCVGAFKFRGAYNAMAKLDDAARRRGVLTYSSGNHAQAVARVGQMLRIETVIVMPDNAPAPKLAATREYGARVITFDPSEQTREDVAAALPEARTHTLIPPFDHYDVIAGQGTCGLELLEQAPQLDRILVPTGGSGLLSGCSVVAHYLGTRCDVIGVEPALADDAARSLRSGRIEVAHDTGRTIADGTRTTSVGQRNFALMQAYTRDVVTVSEEAIRRAMRFVFERLKQVVEPSGVLGLAALMEGAVSADGRSGVILSGGNADPRLFAEIIGAPAGDR
ncbi:MAG: pyridoxal-phosphate dependent enzyme [Pseudomonadota bacterium]